MASACNRFISRTSTSSLKSAIKSKLGGASLGNSAAPSSPRFSLPTRSTSSPLRRFSLSRTPSELGGVQSMLPLHSAVAAARMTSCLSSASTSCRALSQAESGWQTPTNSVTLRNPSGSYYRIFGTFVKLRGLHS